MAAYPALAGVVLRARWRRVTCITNGAQRPAFAGFTALSRRKFRAGVGNGR